MFAYKYRAIPSYEIINLFMLYELKARQECDLGWVTQQ